jgi:hypothetical protein
MQSHPYLVDMIEFLEEQDIRLNALTTKPYLYKMPYPVGKESRQKGRLFGWYQTPGGVGGGGSWVLMPPTGPATRTTPHIQVP